MRPATIARPSAVLAALLALIVGVVVPAAQADGKIILDSGHTDAFYIISDSGTPKVLVANRSDFYNPDDTIFRIGTNAYSTGHDVKGPFPDPVEGYFTGSMDVTPWFEPGWNAPGFRDVFQTLRVDFTRVTGPGRLLIVGNSEDEEGIGPRRAYLADGSYDVVAGSSLPITGHTHVHWFFSHAGDYQLTGQAVGTRPDGTEVASEPFTITYRIDRNEQDTRGQGADQPSPAPEPTTEPSVQPSPAPGTEPGPAPEPSAAPTAEPTAAPSSAPGSGLFDTHEPYRLTRGHVDLFNVVARDGSLVMTVKDESTGRTLIRQPEDVTVVVGEGTRREFSGRIASTLVASGYFLPESGANQQEAPYPGWDTYSVEPEFSAVDLEVVDVTGPGRVFLFTSARGGMGSQLVSGGYELNDGEVIRMNEPGHVHTNWLFESPGTYTMTVRATGTSGYTGQAVTSASATYTWVVGEAATPAPSATAGTDPTPSAQPSPTGAGTASPTVQPSASTAPTGRPGGPAAPGARPGPTASASTSATPTATASTTATATPSASSTSPGRAPLAAAGGAAGGSGALTGGGGAGSGLARTGSGTTALIGVSLVAFVGGAAFLASRRRQA